MKNTGQSYPLNDSDILKINSPRSSVGGPYTVIFKNTDERWAIVAFHFGGKPRLGMRWFWGNGGNPFSSGNGTWLVIPPSLSKSILSGLPLDHTFACKIDDFLCGKLTGKELQS